MAARCSTDRPVAHVFTLVDALRSTPREPQRRLQCADRYRRLRVATPNRWKLLDASALWTYELRSSRQAWLPLARERPQVFPMSVVGGCRLPRTPVIGPLSVFSRHQSARPAWGPQRPR